MGGVEQPGGRFVDRRRGARIRLAVPVHMHGVISEPGGSVPRYTAHTVDLSTSGARVTLSARDGFVPGAILLVSIGIPWEHRGIFPFSRIVGSCRIVRVDRDLPSQDDAQTLALAFCGEEVTFLGAILAPTY